MGGWPWTHRGGRTSGYPMATLHPPTSDWWSPGQDNPPAHSGTSQLSQEGGESLRGLLWCGKGENVTVKALSDSF